MDLKYFGIGASSTICHLPECERDVQRTAGIYSRMGSATHVLHGSVVPYAQVIDGKHLLYGCEHAVVHFSGHGLLSDDRKTYYLWLGDETNCVEYARFSEEVVQPLAARCGAVTVLLDCCFAGRAAKKGAAVEFLREGRTAKTIGFTDLRYRPDADISEHGATVNLDNVAVCCACSKREMAYAQFTPATSGGYGTLGTEGMSLWSYILANHIARATGRRAGNDTSHNTVKHIMAETKYCSRALLESEDTPQWRAAPPRCEYPTTCWRIGRKHKALLIDFAR